MDQYSSILSRNYEGENILHICAKRKIKEALFRTIWDALTDYHKDNLIIQTDNDGNIPLYVAIHTNNKHVYKMLLEYTNERQNHNKSWSRYPSNRTVFHEIAKTGCIDLLEQMKLDSTKSESFWDEKEIRKLLNIRDEKGYTCLHIAAAKGKHLCAISRKKTKRNYTFTTLRFNYTESFSEAVYVKVKIVCPGTLKTSVT